MLRTAERLSRGARRAAFDLASPKSLTPRLPVLRARRLLRSRGSRTSRSIMTRPTSPAPASLVGLASDSLPKPQMRSRCQRSRASNRSGESTATHGWNAMVDDQAAAGAFAERPTFETTIRSAPRLRSAVKTPAGGSPCETRWASIDCRLGHGARDDPEPPGRCVCATALLPNSIRRSQLCGRGLRRASLTLTVTEVSPLSRVARAERLRSDSQFGPREQDLHGPWEVATAVNG